jgi:hypothetical protein
VQGRRLQRLPLLADDRNSKKPTHSGKPDIVSFLIFDGTGKRMA